MSTRTNSRQITERLANRWREGHLDVNAFFDDFRHWAYEASPAESHFGQAAARLKRLRERLVEHFQHEDELASQFAACKEGVSPEIDANRRQIESDHRRLLRRLDSLTEQLGKRNPPFGSWTEAIEQIELFADALDQHEEQESDSIAWLMPRQLR